MKIVSYYPNYFRDFGIAHACYNLNKYMQSEYSQITLYGLSSDQKFNDDFYKNLIPSWSKSLVYKFFSNDSILKFGEAEFLKSVSNSGSDIAYLWPGISLEAYKKIKRMGLKIIYEGVNTHESNSKEILDAEYSKLGLPITHGVASEKVIGESAKLELADYIFSTSPIMSDVYLKYDVAPQKILQTSYGLSSQFILERSIIDPRQDNAVPTFLFVGSIDVRKGIHLLLDYWVKANLKANLVLVGKIDTAVLSLVNAYLEKHQTIQHIPFTMDLPTIYKKADVFILPSLEEGSPLVTYLALGAGLPVLASPMGAGGIITDGQEGFVIDPHDEATWVQALHKMNDDFSLRKELSENAHKKASFYTWQAVGERRISLLMAAESLAK